MIARFAVGLHKPKSTRSEGIRPDTVDDWLDTAALARLADDTAADLVPGMIDIFVDELRDQATAIRAASNSSDLPSLARESHVIKSSAATFGLPRVAHSAHRLNTACTAKNRDAALMLAEDLLANIDPSIRALAKTYNLGRKAVA